MSGENLNLGVASKDYAVKFRHVVFALLILLLALAVVTYNPADTAVLEGGSDGAISNAIGLFGAEAGRFLFYWFGITSYPLLLVLLAGAVRSVFPRKYPRRGYWLGVLLFALSFSILFGLNPGFFVEQTAKLGIGRVELPESALSGGVIGQWFAGPGSEYAREGWVRAGIGMIGTLIIGWCIGLGGLILMIFADWRDVGEYILDRSGREDDPSAEIEVHEEVVPEDAEPQSGLDKTGVEKRWRLFGMFRRGRERVEEDEVQEEPPQEVALPLEEPHAEEEAVSSRWQRMPEGEELHSVLEERRRAAVEQPSAPSPVVSPEPVNIEPAPVAAAAVETPAVEPAPAPQPVAAAPSVPVRERVTSISLNGLSGAASITVGGGLSVAVPPRPAVAPVAAAAVETPAAASPAAVAVPSPAPVASAVAPSAVPAAAPVVAAEPVEILDAPAPDISRRIKGDNVAAPSSRYYTIPPVSMLSRGEESVGVDIAEIERSKQILQDVLDSFKVDAQVIGHTTGPRITRFEIALAPGVDVSKVTKLKDNIKMDMRVTSVRIQAPIPGHNAVGVEIPNSHPSAVFARDIMESPAWRESRCEIPVVLGRNVSGEPVVIDLAKAPHLLIAGATGSGKSVCMNSLIISLLMHFPLDDLRLILVDPKVVEHEFYRKLPQLITPVINDAEKVPLALRWAVNEMEKRYRMLAHARVKKLSEYNEKLGSGAVIIDQSGQPLPKKLPVLIIILDELADLMMTEARGEVETCINRIAAKGRAAGIHIVVATQSPRKDVVTGLIKANLPTRISFAVSSQMDSRVILDRNGAETLLGRGDMLLMMSGAELERIQGAMICDEDIEKVVKFISDQAGQEFDTGVMSDPASEEDEEREEIPEKDLRRTTASNAAPIVRKYLQPGDDDLVARALEVIITERKASTSALQRRLKIGYNRAADLMDLFEERGLIGPDQQGGKQREVLIFDGLESGDY